MAQGYQPAWTTDIADDLSDITAMLDRAAEDGIFTQAEHARIAAKVRSSQRRVKRVHRNIADVVSILRTGDLPASSDNDLTNIVSLFGTDEPNGQPEMTG